MSKVVMGVDPHKRVNAVCVVDRKGKVVARREFDNTVGGFRELKQFWRQWRQRSWAVEGCNGVGKYLAQRLVADGETVMDVSTRRAALVRVHAGGNGRKIDDTDAESIALVGLRTAGLPQVRTDELTVSLKLLANRRDELVAMRIQAACRIHRDLVVLVPGGVSKRLTAKCAQQVLERIEPRDEIGQLRRQLLADQIDELISVDRRLLAINKQIKKAVADAHTRLTGLFGLGLINTARILGDVGDVSRFRSRHHFASYNGTRPHRVGQRRAGQPAGEHQRQPQTQPRDPHRRRDPGSLRDLSRARVLRPQDQRGKDPQRSDAGAETEDLRCRLPPARRRRRRSTQAGPGRASGGDSTSQRDRPNPDSRLFGKATTRTPQEGYVPRRLTEAGNTECLLPAPRGDTPRRYALALWVRHRRGGSHRNRLSGRGCSGRQRRDLRRVETSTECAMSSASGAPGRARIWASSAK